MIHFACVHYENIKHNIYVSAHLISSSGECRDSKHTQTHTMLP